MSNENNIINMKLKDRRMTYKKPQQNIYIKRKTLSDKYDYNKILSNNNHDKLEVNNKSKNNFISITDFSDNNDDNNFMSIIHSSIIYPNNNFEKIKSVDANNYLNKENNSITSFNDLKLSILNKKHSFNTPFIFCRNGIDLQNPKKIEEEKNYQIKRYRYLKHYKYSFNPIIRRQNSKIIQKWWKKKINPKVDKRKKITKIQSIYRGYITRKHLNDIICISVIYQNFINKLRKVFTNFVRRNYFPKRYYKKKYALEKIFPLKLKLFFRKWKKYKNLCEQKEKEAKNMIKIRNKNRYRLLILKAFFHIWKLKCDEIISLINQKCRIINNKLSNIINNLSNKIKLNKMRNVLNKWKKLVYYYKLNDLKAKNLETVARLTKIVYDSKKMTKNLYLWKEKNNLMKFINKNKYKDNVNNLYSCLDKIKNERMKTLFNCFKKAKYNLLKKIIIKNIANNHQKNILKSRYNKWKIKTLKVKSKYQLLNLDKLNKLKNIVNNFIKKQEKSNYGLLKKTINKWYLISKLINKENINTFLKNINTALTKVYSVLINNLLKETINKIKLAGVNNKNIILNRLKKYFIKNDKNNLRIAFHKFVINTLTEGKNILKANIVFNIKQKYEQLKDKILLMKYLNKWKLLSKFTTKEQINSLKNLLKTLNKVIKNKLIKYSFDKLKGNQKKYYLNEFIKKVYNIYEIIEKRCLHNNFQKWKKISDKIKFNESQKQKGYEIIYNTLSKAFAYKKIGEKLSSLINKHRKKYYKFFMDKYKRIFQNKIKFSFKNQIKNNITPKKIHLNFKNNIKSKKSLNNILKEEKKETNENINTNMTQRPSKHKISNKYSSNITQNKKEQNKNIILSFNNNKNNFYNERLIPYLIKYINKLRIRRLKYTFEKIEYIYKTNLFCHIYNSFNKKQITLSKKNLINSFKTYIFKQKIIDYMRKKGIEKLTSYYLIITKKRNDLFILVHLTKIFKRINQLKKSMRYVKLWRLYIKLLKERAAQLEKMEKSFSQTYEKLSDSIFVDIGDEKSVQTQMMTFVDKVNSGDKNRKINKNLKSMDSLSSLYIPKNSNDNINISNSNITFMNKFSNDVNQDDNDNDIKKESRNKIKSNIFKKSD